jgi:hypothetical protein
LHANKEAAMSLNAKKRPIHDMKSDWKRWNRAERVSAIALVATFIIIYGSSIVGMLSG